jgi:hypothetical protein
MTGRRRGLQVAAAACLVPPVHAREALPMPTGGRPWRIGGLSLGGTDGARSSVGAFVARVRAKAWVQGEHCALEPRTSDDGCSYPALAAALVALAPDVLLSVETTARALRQHTMAIPIVLRIRADEVIQ